MKSKLLMLGLMLALAWASVISVAAHEPAKASGSSPSMQLHAAMMAQPKMKMTGDVDRDFAAMMIEHHRQALRMADIEIAHGRSAELRGMAEKMKADQSAEIKRLEKFK